MRFARRYWAGVVLAGLLVTMAVVVREPVLLGGAAAILGVLVGRAAHFVRDVDRLWDELVVDASFERPRAIVDRPVGVDVTVELPEPVGSPVWVDVDLPPGARLVGRGASATDATDEASGDTDGRADWNGEEAGDIDRRTGGDGGDVERATVVVPAGEERATERFDLVWLVPGRHSLGPARVTAADDDGYVRASVRRPVDASVVVDVGRPRGVHVGRGGAGLRSPAETETEGRTTGGIDFVGIRQYVPGDPIRNVDWKATARLNDLHIRLFGSEPTESSLFVFDGRSSVATGDPGRRKFDYLRYVALQLEAVLRDERQPLGLVAVDDDGLASRVDPGSTRDTYRSVRAALHRLDPGRQGRRFDPGRQGHRLDPDRRGTGRSDGRRGGPPDEGSVPSDVTPSIRVRRRRSRSDARRAAKELDGETAYERRLRPFFAAAADRVAVDGKPLLRAVNAHVRRIRAPARVFVFTDDTHRGEVREAVETARSASDEVVVFLAPAVLFAPGDLSVDAAYERLLEFESFRRSLDRLSDVRAYEVGPGDRLEHLLGGRRESRRNHGGATAGGTPT